MRTRCENVTSKEVIRVRVNRFLVIALVLALVVGMLFVACAPSAPQTGPKEILLGLASPLTGLYGAFGTEGSWGLQAAIDDINKVGGVQVNDLGRKLPLKVIILDNQSDPQRAASLCESLILQDKVNMLVNPYSPPPMHPGVATVAQRYKVPYVCGTAVLEPWLGMRSAASPAWTYTWATAQAIVPQSLPPDQQNTPGLSILGTWFDALNQVASQTNKKVAISASDDPDGAGWYAGFGQALQANGYTVIGLDKKLGLFPPETTDFSSIINEWKDAGAEVLWANAPGPLFGALYKQARASGFKPKMVAASRAALFYTDVVAWGGDLPNGVCCEMPWTPAIKQYAGVAGTTPQSLNDRWVKEKGIPPSFGIGWGYSTPQIVADAIQRAGSLDGEKINSALSATDLLTMFQRVKYDPQTQTSPLLIVMVQWFPSNTALKWEQKIIFSKVPDWMPAQAQMVFPIP